MASGDIPEPRVLPSLPSDDSDNETAPPPPLPPPLPPKPAPQQVAAPPALVATPPAAAPRAAPPVVPPKKPTKEVVWVAMPEGLTAAQKEELRAKMEALAKNFTQAAADTKVPTQKKKKKKTLKIKTQSSSSSSSESDTDEKEENITPAHHDRRRGHLGRKYDNIPRLRVHVDLGGA